MEMFIKRDILYLRFEGEFDQSSVMKFKYKIIELIEKYRIKHVVFNFRKLNFMDSSGIGFIIGRYNFLKKINGKVFICSMNEQIRRIVLLSGLAKICVIKDDEIDVNRYLGVA
jgi:stage II sporulation protein AA (anti-sigma F factor antagonist)